MIPGRALKLLRDRPGLAWAAGLALLTIVAYFDRRTGLAIGFGVFYLIPVLTVSWPLGARQGLLMAFASACVWHVANNLWGMKWGALPPEVGYWNAFTRFVYFAIAVLLVREHRSLEQEQEVSRLKSSMLSLVSHEFSNSLTSMNLALILLRESEDGPAPADRRTLYETLDRVLATLQQATQNFLNEARLASGRFQPRPGRTSPRELVRNCLAVLQPLADQKRLEVRLDFPTQELFVNADAAALAIVLSNLIGNAIKYTPEKGRVSIRVAPTPAGRARISVEDTGIGIAPRDREKIFGGFYRTEQGRRTARGFGVGLSISRELLETGGSTLELDSEPGKGSRFYFLLPLWDAASVSPAN